MARSLKDSLTFSDSNTLAGQRHASAYGQTFFFVDVRHFCFYKAKSVNFS